MIITEKCVFQVDPEAGLKLAEIADGMTVDEVRAATGGQFEVGRIGDSPSVCTLPATNITFSHMLVTL